MLSFYSNLLTFDHTLLFAQKCSKNAKGNSIFHLKEIGDRALILPNLDSPMAKVFLYNYLFFSILAIFWGNGVQSRTKRANFGYVSFLQKSEFCRALQHCFSLFYYYLCKVGQHLGIWGSKGPKTIEKVPFHGR